MSKRLIFVTLALLVVTAAGAGAATLKGKVTLPGLRDDSGAVVYVEGSGIHPAQPAKPVVMDQKGTNFVPHVLPVEVGTTVEFLNSDSVSHNVFTPDKCAGKFNLGTWGKGQERSHTFDKPCKAVMLCAIHPEMEAYVVAVPTPYFAVTDASGSYQIPDLPDGTYTVKVWHPKAGETSKTVTVSGSAADVDLQVSR